MVAIIKTNWEKKVFLELWTLFKIVKYELWTELVCFKICELNFELVHVESELSQHWCKCLNHSFCASFVKSMDELIVHCSYILYSAVGERARAHIRLPHGPPESLQAFVEVCHRAPCLLPPTWPRPEKLSPLRVHQNGLTFQIQVSFSTVH